MKEQARRSDKVTKQDGMPREDSSPDSIQPYPSPYEQIPSQHMRPLFRDKVGIVRHHVHEGSLRILGRIKDIIEF